MKRKICLVLSMTACSMPASGATLDELEVHLAYYATAPELQLEVRHVQSQTQNYEKLFTQALAISQEHQLEVTVIGQFHDYLESTPAEHRTIMASQSRVRLILDSLKCDLICTEGSSDSTITVADLQESLEPGNESDSLFKINLEKCLRMDGAMSYLWANPSAVVIGAEDRPLNHLHARALNVLAADPAPSPSYWLNLFVFSRCLRSMRSELALAKTIVALHQCGLTRGGIVMGIGHRDDFLELFKKYHITGKYLPAE